jgi:CheY-like chemotaxis protein
MEALPMPETGGQNVIRIVMADDDPEDRMLTEQAWHEARLTNPLDFVIDGIDLLDYLRRQGDYTHLKGEPLPGLILLDLNMPRMDGREALKEIKADPALRHIPVVALTTSQAEEDIFRTYNLGVNSFIVKPVSFAGLVDVVRTVNKYWFQIVTLSKQTETC